jgi:hypothetical protein
MNASEQLFEARTQDRRVQQVNDAAQRQGATRPSMPPPQVTRSNEAVSTGLQKAMEELVRAQDHLHSASDQGSEAISKAIAGIIQNVRGLQRELSNVIHSVSCGK